MHERPIHALLVEDEEAHVELLRRVLEEHTREIRLTVVGSLQEARAFLEKRQPDLVIADVVLPDGRGTELVEGGLEARPYPVVVITAYGNEQMAVDTLKAGALDYVAKSAEALADMPRTVERALRQWGHIMERKRAEEALRESEERYRSFVQNFQGIAFRGYMDFTPIFFHGAVEEITGYTQEEFTAGRPRWDQIIHPDDLAEVYKSAERLITIPGHSVDRQYRIIRNDGQVRWIGEVIHNLCDDSGRPALVQGALYDITDRKRAEEALREYSERLVEMVEERTRELREAQEELLRSEKLALLGEVAGAMGHELRNPLGAIKNAVYYLNMVLEAPDPEVRDTLDILNLEASNCAKIVQDLLDFARSRPPVHVEIQINDTVRGALSDIPVPEGVEVVTELDEGLPPILADAIQLNQVFGNIITNAFQAMPEGGRLLVRSRAAEGEGVAISFADTGVGIPKENLERMFKPLFTTKARGIGLGLAAVRLLVERHGGKVEVESEPGRGSTFTVWLPVGGASDRPAPGADA